MAVWNWKKLSGIHALVNVTERSMDAYDKDNNSCYNNNAYCWRLKTPLKGSITVCFRPSFHIMELEYKLMTCFVHTFLRETVYSIYHYHAKISAA